MLRMVPPSNSAYLARHSVTLQTAIADLQDLPDFGGSRCELIKKPI
jgi:hypothetical protein